MDIDTYVKGISKASFCKPTVDQQYISFAHFISLQPRECMKVRDEFSPDAMILGKLLYVWLPTPPKKSADQLAYAENCRQRLVEVASQANFDRVLLDLRGNIGGTLSTVVNAIYPIIADRIKDKYLSGISKSGKEVATFKIKNGMHVITVRGSDMETRLIPIQPELENIFTGKPIDAFCNKYTMSTGEIICIIVRKLGGKLYGERTRGLTNGMEIISEPGVKSVNIPYYSIADGKKIYNGVEPDYGFSALRNYLSANSS